MRSKRKIIHEFCQSFSGYPNEIVADVDGVPVQLQFPMSLDPADFTQEELNEIAREEQSQRDYLGGKK